MGINQEGSVFRGMETEGAEKVKGPVTLSQDREAGASKSAD